MACLLLEIDDPEAGPLKTEELYIAVLLKELTSSLGEVMGSVNGILYICRGTAPVQLSISVVKYISWPTGGSHNNCLYHLRWKLICRWAKKERSIPMVSPSPSLLPWINPERKGQSRHVRS